MAISVKHAFQSAKADGPDSTLIQPSSWNAEHTITAAAGVVLGRNTSGAGAIQELPLAVDTTGNLSLPTGAGYAINGTSVLTATALGSGVVTSSLTSVGTITTGTWNATTIAVNRGGTGATSLTSGYLLKGNGTSAVSASVVYESGGNVGIGTSSPNAKLEVSGDIAVTGGGNIRSSSTSSVWSISGGNTYNNGGSIIVAGSTSGIIPGGIAFNTGTGATNTERMRIQGNGYFLLNTAAIFPGYNSRFSIYWASDAEQGMTFKTSSTTFNGQPIQFLNSSNGVSGYIAQSASSVTYATSSDARIKKNIVDAPEAGSLIDAIQVRSWDFKVDGTHWRYGMVAQELLGVAPEAVNVPENPDMIMGVDYSKLVPMLIKELQSVRARVAALEAA